MTEITITLIYNKGYLEGISNKKLSENDITYLEQKLPSLIAPKKDKLKTLIDILLD